MSGLAGLAAEAMSKAEDGEDIEKQLEDALACPCVADLREGPCGPNFVNAFSCYIRSSHEEKGMDCLDQFQTFQECLKKHPEHVEQIMKEAQDLSTKEDSNGGSREEMVAAAASPSEAAAAREARTPATAQQ